VLRLKEFHLPLLLALLLMWLYPLNTSARRLIAQDDATFTLPDGSLSFELPAGWVAEDHGHAILLTIYEYSSYGCPSCREHYQDGTTEEIIGWTEFAEFEGQVRFVFRNFPVIVPQTDPIGAEVAQCVLDIGQDAFWDYHFTLYELSDEDYYALSSADDFVEVAAGLGYDGDALGECYASRQHRGAVNYQANRAREAPAYGTPSYFLNDERVGTVRGFEPLIRYQLE
jgi:protein-disulfide isomerase